MQMTMQEWQNALATKCELLVNTHKELMEHADSFAFITNLDELTEEEFNKEMARAMERVTAINAKVAGIIKE